MNQRWRTAMTMMCVGGVAWLGGCQQTESPASLAAAAAPPPWKTQGAAMSARLSTGMTREAVEQALGQPTSQYSKVSGGDATIVWFYSLTNNVDFRVRFDAHGHVVNYGIISPIRP